MQRNVLDKPVVNQTGLTGRYDFTLKFTPDPTQVANFGRLPPGNAADTDAPRDIFSAFQQQFGLNLESTKTLVDVMVIENVARPSGQLKRLQLDHLAPTATASGILCDTSARQFAAIYSLGRKMECDNSRFSPCHCWRL